MIIDHKCNHNVTINGKCAVSLLSVPITYRFEGGGRGDPPIKERDPRPCVNVMPPLTPPSIKKFNESRYM